LNKIIHIIFGLIKFFSKKPKPVQIVRFRFGYFITKTVFSGLARVFFVWVRFGLFFDLRLIKLKSNHIGRFFKISNRFNRVFFTVRFFQLLFSSVLGLSIFRFFLSPLMITIIFVTFTNCFILKNFFLIIYLYIYINK